ncbi:MULTISPECIES: ankyrin repeat domain-containing protein [Aerosakkonema]|uniref:ankyrin repeat domain-containing protein n=1 Tax=Aerosakkonema TaxID=1246629 RepID=UPI0035B98175
MAEKTLVKEFCDLIRQGDLERLVALIKEDKSRLYMTTVFGTWLHFAASEGKLEIVEYLIAQGLDVNTHCESVSSLFTPIQAAVYSGKANIVRYLLSCGAIIDTNRGSIENILFLASHRGYTEIIQLLIESGIDAKVKYNSDTMKNMDALALAYEYGQEAAVNILRPYSLG